MFTLISILLSIKNIESCDEIVSITTTENECIQNKIKVNYRLTSRKLSLKLDSVICSLVKTKNITVRQIKIKITETVSKCNKRILYLLQEHELVTESSKRWRVHVKVIYVQI